MTTLVKSISDVITKSEDLSLEASALALKPNKDIDRYLILAGLESATSLRETISQEGVLTWISSKLKTLGRKITIAINKIVARLTRADEATKALIKRAEKDPNVTLPLSGKQASALLAITAALVTVVTGGLALQYKAGDNLDREIKYCENLVNNFEENIEYRDWGNSPGVGAAKRAEYDKVRLGRTRLAFERGRLRLNKVYVFCKTMQKHFAALKQAFGKLFSKYKNVENSAVRAKTDGTIAVSFYDRLKMLGFLFVRIFALVRKWFACLPRLFKGTVNPGNLPVMYNNLEPY